MAPGQIITAAVTGVAGAKAAPFARSMVPMGDVGKTLTVAGGGVLVAAGGVMLHNKSKGAGLAGPAIVGFGLGTTLGAVADHFGW